MQALSPTAANAAGNHSFESETSSATTTTWGQRIVSVVTYIPCKLMELASRLFAWIGSLLQRQQQENAVETSRSLDSSASSFVVLSPRSPVAPVSPKSPTEDKILEEALQQIGSATTNPPAPVTEQQAAPLSPRATALVEELMGESVEAPRSPVSPRSPAAAPVVEQQAAPLPQGLSALVNGLEAESDETLLSPKSPVAAPVVEQQQPPAASSHVQLVPPKPPAAPEKKSVLASIPFVRLTLAATAAGLGAVALVRNRQAS